jgi:hypothetical protein
MGKLAFRLHDSPKTRESQRRTTGEGQETRTRNPAAGLILENQSLVKIALLPQLGIVSSSFFSFFLDLVLFY